MKRLGIAFLIWLAWVVLATTEHFTLGLVPDPIYSAVTALLTFALILWCDR